MKADPAVTRAAGIATFLARNGDRRGVAKAVEGMTRDQLGDLVFTLAASADRFPPRVQRPPRQGHAEFNRLRKKGIERHEMPAWVIAGEREYMRLANIRRARRLQPVPGGPESGEEDVA